MSCWPHNLFHRVFYCNVAVHVCVYMHLGVRLHALLWLVCQCCSVLKKLFGIMSEVRSLFGGKFLCWFRYISVFLCF
jgi:hypothetical protein